MWSLLSTKVLSFCQVSSRVIWYLLLRQIISCLCQKTQWYGYDDSSNNNSISKGSDILSQSEWYFTWKFQLSARHICILYADQRIYWTKWSCISEILREQTERKVLFTSSLCFYGERLQRRMWWLVIAHPARRTPLQYNYWQHLLY